MVNRESVGSIEAEEGGSLEFAAEGGSVIATDGRLQVLE